MKKIVTMCRQGLVRSVALADVLKLHFEPVDVIPIGYAGNTTATKRMLWTWADLIIVMEEKYLGALREEDMDKAHVCEVGPDTYGNSHNPKLIDFCWRWCRSNSDVLEIAEHFKKL